MPESILNTIDSKLPNKNKLNDQERLAYAFQTGWFDKKDPVSGKFNVQVVGEQFNDGQHFSIEETTAKELIIAYQFALKRSEQSKQAYLVYLCNPPSAPVRTLSQAEFLKQQPNYNSDQKIIKLANYLGVFMDSSGQISTSVPIFRTQMTTAISEFQSRAFAQQQEIASKQSQVTQKEQQARQSEAKKTAEYIKQFDEVNDIINQYCSGSTLSLSDVSRSEYQANFPVEAKQQRTQQVVAESTSTNARPQWIQNPTTGKYEQATSYNETKTPSSVKKLTIPNGDPVIVNLDHKAQELFSRKLGVGQQLVFLHSKNEKGYLKLLGGTSLSEKNFGISEQRADGTIIVKDSVGTIIKKITPELAMRAVNADAMVQKSFNTPAVEKAKKQFEQLVSQLQPLQTMREKFQQSSVVSSEGNISDTEIYDTRVQAQSALTNLLPQLEGSVSERKQQKSYLQAMLDGLDPNSPLIGTQKSIRDMILAYDTLIGQCESRGGNPSALRSFLSMLTNPAEFREITRGNFFKKNSPMIIGAVIGAIATIGSGGALGIMALGVLGGMGLGRVFQAGADHFDLFDTQITVDGKKVTLNFENPTDVELWRKGKMSGGQLATGLLQEFTMQFVMQIALAKGLSYATNKINLHLAQFPNSIASRFLRIIKPKLPELTGKWKAIADDIGAKVKPYTEPVKQVIKSKGGEFTTKTSSEAIEEHREEITEQFMNKLDKTGGSGFLVNFLVGLYTQLNPRDVQGHHKTFFDTHQITETAKVAIGTSTVLQQLETKNRERIDAIKEFYKNQGFDIDETRTTPERIVFKKKVEVTNEKGEKLQGTQEVEVKKGGKQVERNEDGSSTKNKYNFDEVTQRENSLNSDKLINADGTINQQVKNHLEAFLRTHNVLDANTLLTDQQVTKIYEVHNMKRMEGETDDEKLNERKGNALRVSELFTFDQIRVIMDGKVCGIINTGNKSRGEIFNKAFEIAEENPIKASDYLIYNATSKELSGKDYENFAAIYNQIVEKIYGDGGNFGPEVDFTVKNVRYDDYNKILNAREIFGSHTFYGTLVGLRLRLSISNIIPNRSDNDLYKQDKEKSHYDKEKSPYADTDDVVSLLYRSLPVDFSTKEFPDIFSEVSQFFDDHLQGKNINNTIKAILMCQYINEKTPFKAKLPLNATDLNATIQGGKEYIIRGGVLVDNTSCIDKSGTVIRNKDNTLDSETLDKILGRHIIVSKSLYTKKGIDPENFHKRNPENASFIGEYNIYANEYQDSLEHFAEIVLPIIGLPIEMKKIQEEFTDQQLEDIKSQSNELNEKIIEIAERYDKLLSQQRVIMSGLSGEIDRDNAISVIRQGIKNIFFELEKITNLSNKLWTDISEITNGKFTKEKYQFFDDEETLSGN